MAEPLSGELGRADRADQPGQPGQPGQLGLDRLVAATVERDVVIITGSEAEVYLQGQVSADVAALHPGQSTLSFLLDPRGRVEAFFIIGRLTPDTFVADTERGFGQAMATSLERFKLRTKVEFSPMQCTMRSVRGPLSAPGLTISALTPSDAQGLDVRWPNSREPNLSETDTSEPSLREPVVRQAHWPLASGYDLLLKPDSTKDGDTAVQVPAGAEPISTQEFEVLRLAYGLPAMGTEIQPGDIPNETGLVEGAASFTKGCYRGQELVERIDSRAGGRRRICRISAAASLSRGDSLHSADSTGTNTKGTEIGTVLSVAPLAGAVVGFASVRRDAGDQARTPDGQAVMLAELF